MNWYVGDTGVCFYIMRSDHQSNNIFQVDVIVWVAMLLFTSNIIIVTWPMVEGQDTTTMQEFNCSLFNDAFSPCEPYVTTDLTSEPSAECCQDIIALDQILGNENLPVEQRVAICMCIQVVQKIEGISDDVDTKLPERCGLNTTSIPRVTSTTDCSTI